VAQRRIVLDLPGGAVEDDQGRVELAALAFDQDAAEQGPDVGLGPVELAALPWRWTLWTTLQAISSRSSC
jgi:hypothetical protein